MTYHQALDALRVAKPDHLLLRLLSMGETPGNRVILDRELAKFTEAEAPFEVEIIDLHKTGDSTLEDLYRQQSDLFGERRRLSNMFHNCSTDGDRRAISEDIQGIQRKIEHVRKQVADYKALGHVPTSDERYPIPDDPFRLIALRDSLRASISRKSRQARELAALALEEKLQNPKSLTQAENKLRDLQTHLQRVQKAIDDRNIQPGRLREG